MIRADGNNHYNRHRGIVIRLLNSMSRDDALLTLVRAVVEPHGLDDQAVLQRVLDREGSLSSRVSERIAMPHAVWEGLDETLLGFGVCRAGIDWDGRAEPVQLVVLLIGPEELHLASISSVSRLLQAPGVVDAIVEARDEHTVHALLSGGDRASAPVAARTLTVTAATVHHAAELARSLPENPVVISTSNRAVLNMLGPLAEYPLAERTFILGPGLKSATGVSRDENERSPADGVPPGVSVISTDRFPDERDGPAVLTLLPLLAINVVRAGSEVILLSGRAEHGGLDAVRLVDISRELQIPDGLAEAHLPEGVRLEVVIRTLHLAAELSVQGREGKAIGSIFVIGDDPGL